MLNGLGDSSMSHLATSSARWSRYLAPLIDCSWATSKPIFFSGVPCQVCRYTWPARFSNPVGMSSFDTMYCDLASASQ